MTSPRSALSKVAPYSVFNENRLEKVGLDLNENAWGCSEKVLDVLRNVKLEDISLYPDCVSLIKKIAKFYDIRPNNLILSNGADDSIRCIFDSMVEEGEEVIIPIPNYGMFDIYGRIRVAKIVNVLYEENFSFPTQKLLAAITNNTKLIVIVNPANPLGTIITEEELVTILEKAKNSFVLLDETYFHFINKSYLHLISQYPNLIVVQTFSKAYGLTGLRLGVLFSNAKNIDNLTKVNLPFAFNMLALKAAEAALDDQDFIEYVIESVRQEIIFLKSELEKMDIEVKTCYTNFILIKVGADSGKIFAELQRLGVLIRDLSKHPMLSGYLRISVGTRENNLKFLSALKKVIGMK